MNTKIDYPEKLLSIVKSLNNIDYLWYEDGQYFITDEWFIGNFAGRVFWGDTEYDAAKKMHEYFIEHIDHDGLVGNIVTNVNYPKCLDKDYPMCLYDMGIVDMNVEDLKIIYIAGKYSGNTHIEIECNILLAKKAMIELARQGWIVYCPHMNSAMLHVYDDISEEYWYTHGLKMLSKCDAIFMLDNWHNSKGAIDEMAYAIELGLPIIKNGVYYSPKEIFNDKVLGW